MPPPLLRPLCPTIAAATASLISPTDAVARLPGRLEFAALNRCDAGMAETGTAADAAVDRGRAAVAAPAAGGALAARCASSHAVMAAKGLGGSGDWARRSGAAAPSPLPGLEFI